MFKWGTPVMAERQGIQTTLPDYGPPDPPCDHYLSVMEGGLCVACGAQVPRSQVP